MKMLHLVCIGGLMLILSGQFDLSAKGDVDIECPEGNAMEAGGAAECLECEQDTTCAECEDGRLIPKPDGPIAGDVCNECSGGERGPISPAPDPIQGDPCKKCENGEVVDRLESITISYNGLSQVWMGTTVTWTITTVPSDLIDEVTANLGTLSGNVLSYDCPSSSASSTSQFLPTISVCGESKTALAGPVVFELVAGSVGIVPAVVCQGQPAQIEYQVSPSGGSLVPAFSGANVTAAGFINGSPTLNPGTHSYTVTANIVEHADLTVLTSTAGTWTTYYVPILTWPTPPADVHFDYTTSVPSPVSGTVEIRHVGFLRAEPGIENEDWIEIQVCGGTATDSVTYTAGLGGDWNLFGVRIGVSLESEVVVSYSFGGVANRVERQRLRIPTWRVMSYETGSQGRVCPSVISCGPWTPVDNSVTEVAVSRIGSGWDWEKAAQCCSGN